MVLTATDSPAHLRHSRFHPDRICLLITLRIITTIITIGRLDPPKIRACGHHTLTMMPQTNKFMVTIFHMVTEEVEVEVAAGETKIEGDLLYSNGPVHPLCGRQYQRTKLHSDAQLLRHSLPARVTMCARSFSCNGPSRWVPE